MRIALLGTVFVAATLVYPAAYGQSGPAASSESATVAVNIERQAIREALRVFGEQTGVQVLFRSEGVTTQGVTSQRVVGRFSAQEALARLLVNTGLKYEFVNARTVRISSAGASPEKEAADPDPADSSSGNSQRDQFDKSAYVPSPQIGESRYEEKRDIEQIIVTAQKREERIQDVPVPVSVISGTTLTENNQLSFRDYYSSVPGVSVQTTSESTTFLSIRGIGPGNSFLPTVGVMVDDAPFSSSTVNGSFLPDFDPGDLDRVEVLRGPQGTLYGASSMGGLIKYVTTDPSTDGFSGRIQMGTSAVHNGAEPGYNIRASTNIPLGSTLAMRVSGFDRQDPAYIDNPQIYRTGVNETETTGARISALWHATDDLSLKISASYQDGKAMGLSEEDKVPGLGDLQQNYLPGTGKNDFTVANYNAVLKAKLGNIDLTAISGYSESRTNDFIDESTLYGFLSQSMYGVQNSGQPYTWTATFKKVTDELRLSIPIGQSVTWLIGGFYTHENDRGHNVLYGANGVTGAIVGTLLDQENSNGYTEYAGFTDLTYTVSERFDVQIGGRESFLKPSTGPQTNYGDVVPLIFHQPAPYIAPGGQANLRSFTYLVTPRFKLSPDVMIYVRAASGYRPGGFNGFAGVDGIPPTYDPDRTKDLDLGLKGDFVGGKVSIDTAFYYILWGDMQTPVAAMLPNGLPAAYAANAGHAKSTGIEMSVTLRPLTGLTLAGWVDYNDSVLTSLPANASVFAQIGTRLPQAMRLSGNLSAEQDFPVSGHAIGFFGGAMSWLGNREGLFPTTTTAARQYFPGYTKLDVRAGIKNDSWTVNIYANNVTDKRGVTGGGLDNQSGDPYAFQIITPRTLGVNVIKTFGSP